MKDERQQVLSRVERQNQKMLERVRESGVKVRPTFVDKLPPGGAAFGHGRKRTI